MKWEIGIGVGVGMLAFLAIIGYNILPMLLLFGLLIPMFYMLKQQGSLGSVGKQIKSQPTCTTTFNEIGGQDAAIRELTEALDFLKEEQQAVKMGIRPLKGILLTGPPGTGKTLLARAAANYTNATFVAAAGSEFIEMYAGVGARRVRQIFDQAKKQAKSEKRQCAIIFIDELEVMASKRGGQNGHLEYDQTLNQLLVEMDGLKANEEVRLLLIAATNRQDLIDDALLRPGRFDRQVKVELPDREGRASILQLHTKNKPLISLVNLDEVARQTFGFSGADLEAVANEAAILAWRDDCQVIEQHHLLEAVEKVMLGERSGRVPMEEERHRVAVHESGHALVSGTLDVGSVATVTIVPRGQAMGYMRPSTTDDRYLYTVSYMKNQIMVALGGAMAEKLWYGDFSTGARNDFAKAWEWAREMVLSGYSKLGIVGGDIPQENIFTECSDILSELRETTLSLIEGERAILEQAVNLLLDRETLNQQEWEQLLVG
ncbi:MAG: AAA family ATPase [Methylocystaceae bacterium]